MLTRRSFTALGAVAGLAACARPAPVLQPEPVAPVPAPLPDPAPLPEPAPPPMPAFYGPITDEPFPIPAVPAGVVPERLWRTEVANPFPDRAPGTIIVDPDAAILHFVESADRAMRYGVSVGADGFSWDGVARLQFTREWPTWKVPEDMIERRPDLEKYSVANGGMPGGPDNPLGARALYLFQNGVDTLYRIHGSAKPEELGQAVSSGCIRMLNHDVIDLHRRSVHGADVVVLATRTPTSGPRTI